VVSVRTVLAAAGLVAGCAIAPARSLGQPQDRGIRVSGAAKTPDGALTATVDGQRYEFGTFHALLIAVEDYKPNFPPLTTPLEDTRRLRHVLQETWGFHHIKTLFNAEATRSTILNELADYVRQLGEDDNLLIYYAGHGQLMFGDEGFWVPYGATRDWTTWIHAQTIQTLIKKIKARHVLLVSDSCFSGVLARGLPPPPPKAIVSQHRLTSCQVLTAGGKELVADTSSSDTRVSPFAFQVLQKLEGHPDPWLTAHELASWVAMKVGSELGFDQQPAFAPMPGHHRENGQFVFVRLGSGPAKAIEALPPPQEGVPFGWLLPKGVIQKREGNRFRYFKIGNDAVAEMVMVWPGSYRRSESERQRPVAPFLIDRFEVSNRRLKTFLTDNPQQASACQGLGLTGCDGDDQPAVRVPLSVARAFAAWADKRLPRESEWEYAACGREDASAVVLGRYPWGDEPRAAVFERCSYPPKVGRFALDESPCGVVGLAGGVREWCELEPPQATRGAVRGGTQVLRGTRGQLRLELAERSDRPLDYSEMTLGFRCLMPLRRP
jgi:hypothetical protein